MVSQAITMGSFPVFLFLSASAVSLFSFLSVASWADARRRERESYYRYEMVKRVAESQGSSMDAALQLMAAQDLELLREKGRIDMSRRQSALRVNGLVFGALGLAPLAALPWLSYNATALVFGLLMAFVGVALFAGSYVVKAAAVQYAMSSPRRDV